MIGKRIAVLAITSPLIFSASSLYLFSEPNNQFLESITPLLTSTPKLEEIPESPPVVPEKENEVQKTELEVAEKKLINNEEMVATKVNPIQIKEESPKKIEKPVSEPVNSKIIQKSNADKPKSPAIPAKNNTQRTVIYRTESRPNIPSTKLRNNPISFSEMPWLKQETKRPVPLKPINQSYAYSFMKRGSVRNKQITRKII